MIPSPQSRITTLPAQLIHASISRSMDDVYHFLANPENLPKWASGLSQTSLKQSGDHWVTQSPMGEVKIKFVEKNKFGVLDHDVTLPSGEVNHNPLRVAKNGNGCEVIFTLYRLPQITDEAFMRDAAIVQKDLDGLKKLFETA